MNSRSDGSKADYYQLPVGCTELQDLISYRNLNAQDGEIFRSIYRKGRASHSDELRDAKKVLFYAKAEVKRLEALRDTPRDQAVPGPWTVDTMFSGGPLTDCIGCEPDDCPCLPDAELEKLERWRDAPAWAEWMAQDRDGAAWYEQEPVWDQPMMWWSPSRGLALEIDLTGKVECTENLEPMKESRPCAN